MLADPELEKGHIATKLLCRMGQVEDIAQTALWLASDASSFVTGQVIDMAGGQDVGRRLNQKPLQAWRRAAH